MAFFRAATVPGLPQVASINWGTDPNATLYGGGGGQLFAVPVDAANNPVLAGDALQRTNDTFMGLWKGSGFQGDLYSMARKYDMLVNPGNNTQQALASYFQAYNRFLTKVNTNFTAKTTDPVLGPLNLMFLGPERCMRNSFNTALDDLADELEILEKQFPGILSQIRAAPIRAAIPNRNLGVNVTGSYSPYL